MKRIDCFPAYGVTTDGRVFSYRSGKFLKPSMTKGGYQRVDVYDADHKRHRLYVHRVVAQTFIDNPAHKPQVNHNDCNPLNNAVSNLQWVTEQENYDHCVVQGHHHIGEQHESAKLSEADVKDIRLSGSRSSLKHLAGRYGVDRSLIWQVKQRKIWKHVA